MRCKRSATWILICLDIIIISLDFDIKNVLGYSKVKTVRVYVWAGLTIILFVSKRIFKVKPYGWNLLTPVP